MNLEEISAKLSDGIKDTTRLLDKMIAIQKSDTVLLNEIADKIKDICASYTDKDILQAIHATQSEDAIYTHCFNVAIISYLISSWAKKDEAFKNKLLNAALVHDIGKLFVDDDVFNKEDKLSNTERAQVSSHTVEGYKTFRNSGLDKDILSTILMHHERCDGSGYPLGLRSEKINPYAKVVGIADVYEAMTAKRKYRTPHVPASALRFIKDNRERFDNDLVNVFAKNMEKIISLEVDEWAR